MEKRKSIIKENGTRKIRVRKNSDGSWSVAFFFIGELVAEEVKTFNTRKECLFQGDHWLSQASCAA